MLFGHSLIRIMVYACYDLDVIYWSEDSGMNCQWYEILEGNESNSNRY